MLTLNRLLINAICTQVINSSNFKINLVCSVETIGVSDDWDFERMGCRISGMSEEWAVDPWDCRKNGLSICGYVGRTRCRISGMSEKWYGLWDQWGCRLTRLHLSNNKIHLWLVIFVNCVFDLSPTTSRRPFQIGCSPKLVPISITRGITDWFIHYSKMIHSYIRTYCRYTQDVTFMLVLL